MAVNWITPPTRWLRREKATRNTTNRRAKRSVRNPALIGAIPTGTTAGIPGSFDPAGSRLPQDLAELQSWGSLGESTAWTTGQYVVLGDGSHAYWDGDSWEAGEAP